MVAAPETEERRRLAIEMRVDHLTHGPIRHRHGSAGRWVDELKVYVSLAGEMHPLLLFALAPQRHRDVANAHRLRDLGVPGRLKPPTHCRLATARLAGDQNALDAC